VTKLVMVVPSETLSLISFFPRLFHRAERERERAAAGDRPARGAAPLVSLLAGGQRSSKGECAAVKRVCGGALSREPKSVSGGAQGPLPGL
jgi:hypothetical protein